MRAALCALAAAFVAGCASLPAPPPAPAAREAVTHFDVTGRLSARRGRALALTSIGSKLPPASITKSTSSPIAVRQ